MRHHEAEDTGGNCSRRVTLVIWTDFHPLHVEEEKDQGRKVV